jgi:hypothetical protein
MGGVMDKQDGGKDISKKAFIVFFVVPVIVILLTLN